MPKFRKKPVVIEAINWNGSQVSEFPEWLKEPWDDGRVMRLGKEVHITTLEGVMTASPGDWIIQGVNGDFDMGRREIAMTLLEETEHIKSKHEDKTREFQTHIFSQWLKSMEEANGLFL